LLYRIVEPELYVTLSQFYSWWSGGLPE
jgi:hypothetical protein